MPTSSNSTWTHRVLKSFPCCYVQEVTWGGPLQRLCTSDQAVGWDGVSAVSFEAYTLSSDPVPPLWPLILWNLCALSPKMVKCIPCMWMGLLVWLHHRLLSCPPSWWPRVEGWVQPTWTGSERWEGKKLAYMGRSQKILRMSSKCRMAWQQALLNFILHFISLALPVVTELRTKFYSSCQ